MFYYTICAVASNKQHVRMELNIFILTTVIIYGTINTIQCQPSFIVDYENNQFLKDGKPFRYISGSMHYFRIPLEHWEDRMLKAKYLGINTIQTYIAWNVHETKENEYSFSGINDFLNFIDLAKKHDLLVIVRPGPYIDSEWDFGGLPPWLLNKTSIKMRSSNALYMKYTRKWLIFILAMLEPVLYRNGGPIIAMQIENEYGIYGCDQDYLQQMKSIFDDSLGEGSVVLFTTDQCNDTALSCGKIPGVLQTIDFGINIDAQSCFDLLRKHQPDGPIVNSEFYTGWFDFWGDKTHNTVPAQDIAHQLDVILSTNASVNLYMLHGGTSFGYYSGANIDSKGAKRFVATNYDYDAPISETGDLTPKYFALRDIFKRYIDLPSGPAPKNITKFAYGKVELSNTHLLMDMIDNIFYARYHPVRSEHPLSMSALGLSYGFVIYRTFLPEAYQNTWIKVVFEHLADRAVVTMDGQVIGTYESDGGSVTVPMVSGVLIDVLVENRGRTCYTAAADASKHPSYLEEHKGIFGDVKIEKTGEILKDWIIYTINDTMLGAGRGGEMERQKSVLLSPLISGYLEQQQRPSLAQKIHLPPTNPYKICYQGIFAVGPRQDTFLRLHGFNEGQVYVNGFNVGRYGLFPQRALYVPKSAFNTDVAFNAITVLEMTATSDSGDDDEEQYAEFVDKPEF